MELALKRLEKEGMPLTRPDDYFAEMFKGEKDMSRIQNKLVKQQTRIKDQEERKLRAQSKKLAKVVRHKQDLDKAREKRTNVEAINQWKEEIKQKGSKAKDLSEFVLNTNLEKGSNFQARKGRFDEKRGGFGAKD